MSSVVYEFLITKKPIIIAKHDYSRGIKMPNDMNILDYVDIYDSEKDNIVTLIKNNIANSKFDMDYYI